MATTQSSVVLLENDPSLSLAMERVLRASGFHTRAFKDFDELAQAGAARDAACLVVDASLATEHGSAVREHLHIGPRTPLIIISGYDEPQTHAMATAAGASVFFAKPFTGRALAETIHRLLLHETPATAPVPSPA